MRGCQEQNHEGDLGGSPEFGWTGRPKADNILLVRWGVTIRISAFRLLELEIWAEHWTVSGLQDRFWLLCCCYNLNLKTTFLNLGLLMKILGLCLRIQVLQLQVWSNNQIVFQFGLNRHLFSKFVPLFVFSISVVKLINQSFDLCNRPAFKMNICHKLKVSYSIRLVIIKHVIVKELLILQVQNDDIKPW
jgi:hypothetical protein